MTNRALRALMPKAAMVLAATLVIVILTGAGVPPSERQEGDVPISEIAEVIKRGEAASITVKGDSLNVVTTDGRRLESRKEAGGLLTDTLRNYGVTDRCP